jgi:type I restriction enzyme M protein
MNADTKRHIDSARQVLVGVVPNPTSQIDQITNALIYKFMDDMDQSAIKAGGEPSFFVGSLERYAWTRLMDARIGNQERMNLYSEALLKFSEAKQLPELFRGIFKSAFLPYRSPETLGLFLKEIDYFDYSHPEELGNAYEYLLSIMSSQGDAGQFRTPRHIIDFIVDVVNPTKDDKVLDPACGTGGFLVSSYKHILEQHDGKDDPDKKEKSLTPDQRRALANNFEGYDIDPGMVRIAQVNMYLHQFKNPKIFQYDSLSSDERWNDKFSVILANPPFMSPKGGIKPHSKFSIQSSRSEVLFVDYIMNHLQPKGRAGIIVPEGVIFQSGTAYKQLRKNLVEDGLFAVASLPSGVFNPYAGVKTSILFFDNEISKRTNDILFIKIKNDGFDLGAQRRPIDKNDLPGAISFINQYKEYLGNDKAALAKLWAHTGEDKFFSVEKAKISEDGDYNLSGDRYRVATDYSNSKWPMIGLGKLEEEGKIEFLRGQGLSKSDLIEEGKSKCIHYGEIYTLYDPIIKNVISRTDFEGKVTSLKGDVLVPATTTADAMGIAVARSLNEQGVIIGGDINIIRTRNKFMLADYLALLISNPPLKIELSRSAKGANILHLSNSDLKRLLIPLPPLEIQEQIVSELDGYSSIISGAKQISQNWKPKIEIDPEWEEVKIEEISDLITKGTTPTTNGGKFTETGINFIKVESLSETGDIDLKKTSFISGECHESLKRSQLRENDILFSIAGTKMGLSAIVSKNILPANTNQALAIIRLKNNTDPQYVLNYLRSIALISLIENIKVGVAQFNLSLKQVGELEIPFPPLETQKQIVEKIEAERILVDSAKKLIGIYEKKTREVLAKLWEK